MGLSMRDESRILPSTFRAFLAVDLEERARSAITRLTDNLKVTPWARQARWVPPENLHLTIKFLGEITPASAERLVESLGSSLASCENFEAQTEGLLTLPNRRRARVLALKVGPAERFAELAGVVEQGTNDAGFEPERRPFRAHLTLARFQRPPSIPAKLSEGRLIRFLVREVTLFSSRLTPGGALYSPVAGFELIA